MKDLINKMRINRLKKKGYEYFTITVDGVVTAIHFYKGVQMKRLVVINMILISLISIIPAKKEVVTEKVVTENVETVEKEITSRSSDEPRVNETEVEETVKTVNYKLTVESDLRAASNVSADEYNKMLEGTNLAGLGGALEQAEKEHGVNGLYLMGLACLESAYRKI